MGSFTKFLLVSGIIGLIIVYVVATGLIIDEKSVIKSLEQQILAYDKRGGIVAQRTDLQPVPEMLPAQPAITPAPSQTARDVLEQQRLAALEQARQQAMDQARLQQLQQQIAQRPRRTRAS